MLAIAGAAVVLVLVAGAVVLTLQKRGAAGPKAAAESAKAASEPDIQTESQNKISEALVAQAALLVSQGKLEQADALLSEVKGYNYPAIKENADMLRKLGEWHALAGRWQLASDRYFALTKADAFDKWTVVTLDYQACGVALVEAGDKNRYKEFCRSACVSAAATDNGDAGQRVLKSCLILPGDKALITMLKPLGNQSEDYVAKNMGLSIWFGIPMSLWKYRCGEYDQADFWCRQVIDDKQNQSAASCEAAIRSILAMSAFQQHRLLEAREQLALARAILDKKSRSGTVTAYDPSGMWYDWAFARILAREAQALIMSPAK